jgi:hypothetical protein
MPIKDGDVIDITGMIGDHTTVHQIGFKPGPARSRSGWLVLLVHEGKLTHRRYDGRIENVSIPKAAAPKKLRGPRA